MSGNVKNDTTCNVKTDIRAMRFLHAIGGFLGILPNMNFATFDLTSNIMVYPILVIAFSIFVFCFDFYGKIVAPNNNVLFSVVVTEVGLDLTVTLTTVMAVLQINILKRCRLSRFLKTFLKLDYEFRNMNPLMSAANCRYTFEVTTVHIVYVVYVIYYWITWTQKVPLSVFKYYFLKDVLYYSIIILALIMRNYALTIKYRFECLNIVLGKFNNAYDVDVSVMCNMSIRICSQNEWTVKKVKKMYSVLVNAVDEYNQIFGWLFIVVYFNILVYILAPINTSLVYGTGKRDLNGMHFGWDLNILNIVGIVLPMMLCWAIFTACGQAADEAAKTPKVCYKVAEELSEGIKHRMLRDELEALAQQASTTCPQFSAAGFFNVNYSTVYSLIGSVSTYLIVLIQSNSST